jgi:hypothetical protein
MTAAATHLAALLILVAAPVSAATLEYRLLVNGVEAPVHNVTPGTYHTLTVEARVTDNPIVPGTPGGLLASDFDLVVADTQGAIIWEEGGFLGGLNGSWKALTNVYFGDGRAEFTPSKINVRFQTSIPEEDWNVDHGAIAANKFAFIVSGKFKWNARPTSLTLVPRSEGNLVAILSGINVGGKTPEILLGASTIIGAPEPGGIVMAAISGLSLVVVRRAARSLPAGPIPDSHFPA